LGIEKNAKQIFFKGEKVAPAQVRSPAGCGGEGNELKRTGSNRRSVKLFL